MTLFRQIATLVTAFFMAFLAITAWNDFRHTKVAIEGQLRTAAENMATTLGVAIANAEEGADPAFIDGLFNVSFDAGHIAKIELVSPDGTLLHIKEQEVSLNSVPDWFTDLVPIEPASGESKILRNWVFYGTIRLTFHPGYAYKALYENLKTLIVWFGVLTFAGLVLLWWLLLLLLRPLSHFQKQAEMVMENKFVQIEPLPKTPDLKRVAEAMNRMTLKVKNLFHEQALALKNLHDHMYLDAETGLGNRRHFTAKLQEYLGEQSYETGCLVMLRLIGLEILQEKKGYEETSNFITSVVTILNTNLTGTEDLQVNRLNVSEFIVHLWDRAEEAEYFAISVMDSLKKYTLEQKVDYFMCVNAALVSVVKESDISTVLSEIDFALNQSISIGPNKIHKSLVSEYALPHGKRNWRNWLELALVEKRFYLVTQKAVDGGGQPHHVEVYIRMREGNGQNVAAGLFMPVAAAVGMENLLEEVVFERILQQENVFGAERVAVNLSSLPFHDTGSLAGLEEFMRKVKEKCKKSLLLEVKHSTLAQHIETAPFIIEQIRKSGIGFGIDHFDLGLPFDWLSELRPQYIKFNAHTLDDFLQETSGSGYKDLRRILDSLEIRLAAVGIDSKALYDRMIASEVEILQGDYVGVAEELA